MDPGYDEMTRELVLTACGRPADNSQMIKILASSSRIKKKNVSLLGRSSGWAQGLGSLVGPLSEI